MPLKRTSHAVYDTKYHLVWAPKYRRWIVREDIRRRLEQVFRQIAEDFGFELVELEVAKAARACLSEFSAPVFDCQSGGNLKEHFEPVRCLENIQS